MIAEFYSRRQNYAQSIGSQKLQTLKMSDANTEIVEAIRMQTQTPLD